MVNLRTDRYKFWSEEDLGIEAWICNDLAERVINFYLRCEYAVRISDCDKYNCKDRKKSIEVGSTALLDCIKSQFFPVKIARIVSKVLPDCTKSLCRLY